MMREWIAGALATALERSGFEVLGAVETPPLTLQELHRYLSGRLTS
jgi:hypothetical protein